MLVHQVVSKFRKVHGCFSFLKGKIFQHSPETSGLKILTNQKWKRD